MIFNGRNEIAYSYGAFGYTRGSGTIWHGGIDIVGLDSDIILMPSYEGKSITGTVVSQRIVPQSSGDLTWEWGYYVCVKLDANQTPDTVNYLYFCHNEKNLVSVGQKVKTGDEIAIMGNTGNAAGAYKHVHFETRQYTYSPGQNPTKYTQTDNAKGIFGTAPIKSENTGAYLYDNQTKLGSLKALYNINVRSAPNTNYSIIGKITAGTTANFYEMQNPWARIELDSAYGWIMAHPYAEVQNE